MPAETIACSVASTVRGSWPSTKRMVGSTCCARAALGAAPGAVPGPGPAACDAAAAAVAPPDDPVPAVPGVPPAAAAGASALTGALPPTALPYERITSLRRRFLAYLAPMPFGYFSNRATMSSIVQCRRLSWSTTDWNSAERLLSLVVPTPPSRMLLASSSGSVASASTGAPLGVDAPAADAVVEHVENALSSSSGSQCLPVCSVIRVASTVTRPRACFAAEGKLGVPATR